MPGHDIVVIGASAGGVEALKNLVRWLPRGLSAAVFVVLHTWPRGTSYLPEILSSAGRLPAVHPRDGEAVEQGRIYVAPPDYHMLLEPGHVRLDRGPRENRTRPAIDPLFRSASRAYGDRVVGVILSGTLDDGTSGMIAIKLRGGIAMVQDPAEAIFADMPQSALRNAAIDYCLPVRGIAETIVSLVTAAVPQPSPAQPVPVVQASEIAERKTLTVEQEKALGAASGITCPECHGALWEIRDAGLLRFECRIGHAFSGESMLADHNDAVERAVWAAVRALAENAALHRRLAEDARLQGEAALAANYAVHAEEAEQHGRQLRQLVIHDGAKVGAEAGD
jgi:two-component system chemotaxis response regulator CheB